MTRTFHMAFKTDDSDGPWSDAEVRRQLTRLEKKVEVLGFEFITYPEEEVSSEKVEGE